MSTEFSRTLSLLRKERGVSQRMAAADLGVSQALLSHYENGIREPGLAFVVKACDYYHVSADYMLGRTLARDGSMLTPEEVLDMAEPGNVLQGSVLATLRGKLLTSACGVLFGLLGKLGTSPPSTRRRTAWAVRSICCTASSTGPPEAVRNTLPCRRRTAPPVPLRRSIPGPGGLRPGHPEPGPGKGCLPRPVP